MTNELEPLKECPFCGGKASTRKGVHSGLWFIDCPHACMDFMAHTEDELIEKWNTRYKRTCKMQRIKRDKYADEYECQTCYGHTWTPFGANPEYCCHCGAEVVDV